MFGKKNKAKVIYTKPTQTGNIKSKLKDQSRKAILPGKRRSKKGNIYYEYRKNRSDMKNKRI